MTNHSSLVAMPGDRVKSDGLQLSVNNTVTMSSILNPYLIAQSPKGKRLNGKSGILGTKLQNDRSNSSTIAV